jgi:hypothetical protein
MNKKTLMLITLALTPAAALAAPALAAPSPTSVSISANPTIVTYGSTTALSGTVMPAQSVKVSVSGTACVKGQTQSPLTVTSTAQGAWSTTVTPGSKTTYQAKAKSTNSTALTVQVRPQVALAKVGTHRFRTRISAAQSFGGKIALFQKQTSAGWMTVKSILLAELASSNGTVVSGKTFRSGIHAHRTVRILLTQRQVGACYLPGISSSISS